MSFKSFFSKKEEEKKQATPQSNGQSAAAKSAAPAPQSQQAEPPAAVQLENAMVENVRLDNGDTRAKVYQELLFSDLLLALVDQPGDDTMPPQDAQTPQNLNVAIMSNPQGVQFAAAFTSPQAAKRWRVEGGQYASIRGQDIFKLLEPSPADVIVINPGSAPFIALNKVEYKMLAQGMVPQSPNSPVQAMMAPEGAPPEASMQISFPPDAFNEAQKAAVEQFLTSHANIEAVALGALLPPNAPSENDWLRTIFLRTKTTPASQEEAQKFCIDLREEILKRTDSFSEIPFEVGVMPDAQFWVAIHENKFALFDKNPPKAQPQAPQPSTTPPPRSARKA